MSNKGSYIVYYDGDCAFCSRWVSVLLDMDEHKVLSFAPLQGSTAKQHLSSDYLAMNTVVFVDQDQVYIKSTAVIHIMMVLGFRRMKVFLLLPRALRDLLYTAVAQSRYQLSKRWQQCPLPDPKHRDQFLD